MRSPHHPTVESGLRESQVIRESKEKQIAELKKMSDQSSSSLHNEWEKKVRGAAPELEEDLFDCMKCTHTHTHYTHAHTSSRRHTDFAASRLPCSFFRKENLSSVKSWQSRYGSSFLQN